MSLLLRIRLSVCLGLILSAAAIAGDESQVRNQLQEMRMQVAKLMEAGRQEEAEAVQKQMQSLIEEVERQRPERSDTGTDSEVLKREIAKLHREQLEMRTNEGSEEGLNELRRRSAVLEDRLRQQTQGNPPHGAERREHAERFEHLRIAVEHLRQAGFPDLADLVMQRVQSSERERAMHGRPDDRLGDIMHKVQEQMGSMQRELAELRREVRQLKESR
jgi:phage shock protein A